MAKIAVNEFVTVDGVMQAPGSPDEDREGGFDLGGWQLPFFDDKFGEIVTAAFGRAGSMLLGRRTYDIFAAYWPNAKDDPIASMMNGFQKYVVSRTLREPLAWENSTLISGDVPAELAKLKASEDREIHVIGSGELVQTLAEHDLVDEYNLMIHPVVLGQGKKLFPDRGTNTRLKLVGTQTTGKGVLLATYVPDR